MVRGKSAAERLFGMFLVTLMLVLMVVTVYPFWYALISSLNSGADLQKGPLLLLPRVFTTASWREVLSDPGLLLAAWITASRTAIVTAISIIYTAMFAYAYSRRYLLGRRWYTVAGLASMYFYGGLIPTFLLFDQLGLYDSYWVYILPFLFGGFWNVIIFNANYKAIPASLIESAKIDGAGEFRIFFQIVLPLSKPVLAALSVFTAVGIWNDYTTTLYFTQSANLQTLQYLILKLVQNSTAAEQLARTSAAANPSVAGLLTSAQNAVTPQTVELAAMVIVSLPMIVLYPFAQRYFIKGVLLGSVKG